MTSRDQVEHARLVARPADRTPVERANDQALEYAIFWARLCGPLAVVGALLALAAWVWTLDWRWAATALLAGAVGGLAGWWGWWIKGNEGWRHGSSDG